VSTLSDDNALWANFLASRDPALREEAILRYVPLVRYVLGRLGVEPGGEYEDLVSQGLLGLIDAVDRYDPSRGTVFSTYATHLIRGRVLDGLRSLDLLSRPARRRVRQLQAAMAELQQRFGRPPEEAEVADFMGLEMKALQHTLADAGRVILSLDASEGDDEKPDLHETLADPGDDMIDSLTEGDLRSELMQAISGLPLREQQILSLYYRDELTMKEIGEVLNLSESRVCQIHARCVLALRSAMELLDARSVSAETELLR